MDISIQYYSMQKLRELYRETQRNASDNFERVGEERMKKILLFANRQYEAATKNNDYASLDEISFYQERFKAVVDVIEEAKKQGFKRPRIQAQIKDIVQQNFRPNRSAQAVNEAGESGKIEKRQSSSVNTQQNEPRQLMQSYFEAKNKQIAQSKLGFKSLLQGMPYAPKKFPVKHPEPLKVSSPAVVSSSSEEMKALEAEVQRLRRELQEKEVEKRFNMEVLQIQKKEYEQRIQQLCRQMEGLHSQNMRLKEDSVKSFPIEHQFQYAPTIYEEDVAEPPYSPYHISYRENDISKIQSKQQKEPYSSTKIRNTVYARTYNHPIKEEQHNDSKLQSQNLELIHELQKNVDGSSYKINRSSNDNKAIAAKSKLSFFRPAMIIYRGDDFEIAVKSAQLIAMQSKKIGIYVNNKSQGLKTVYLDYKYDPKYYEIRMNKKLSQIEPKSQGKQQVQVRLLHQKDLDSLIEVKMAINGFEVMFLLPAMFIYFSDKRPIYQNNGEYKQQKVLPISHFSSLVAAEEYIPLERLYGEHHQAGRVYAVSRNNEGYIYLRWEGGRLEIETIAAWRLLLGYLMMREY